MIGLTDLCYRPLGYPTCKLIKPPLKLNYKGSLFKPFLFLEPEKSKNVMIFISCLACV